MRLRLRILGADVFDLATGRDAGDQAFEQGPGSTSPDLQPAPRFGSGSADDEPRVYPEDRKRR